MLPRLDLVRVVDTRNASYLVTVDPTDLFIQQEFRKGVMWEAQPFHAVFDNLCAVQRCDDGVVLDLGANVGSHAMYIAKHLATELWAFEPQRKIFQQLVGNLLLNSMPHVWAMNVALSSASGAPLQLQHSRGRPTNYGEAAVVAAPPRSSSKGASREEIYALNLDEVWTARGRPRIPLIKIDVEGHEVPVFKGAAALLHQERPAIVFEDRTGASRGGRTVAHLKSLGFYCVQKLLPHSKNYDFVALPRRNASWPSSPACSFWCHCE